MVPFNVVSLGGFLSRGELSIVCESFANFYRGVTSKHQRRSVLNIIDIEDHRSWLFDEVQELDILPALNIISSSNRMEIIKIYQQASVLVLPIERTVGKIIPEALAFGIPVVCFDSENMREYLDQTCAMFVRPQKLERSAPDFTDIINMLYFDPEVRKILKRGASLKYDKSFSWYKFEQVPRIQLAAS
ncbi:MAG: glycosyltransferase [Bacteroidota bacterium]